MNDEEPLSLDDLKALYPYVLEAAEAEPDEQKRRLLVAALTASAVPQGPLYDEDAFLHLLHKGILVLAPIIDEHGLSVNVTGMGFNSMTPLVTVDVDTLGSSPPQVRYLTRIAETHGFVWIDLSAELGDEEE